MLNLEKYMDQRIRVRFSGGREGKRSAMRLCFCAAACCRGAGL